MDRESDTRRNYRAAAITAGTLAAATVVALGPGGIHGVSYWSSSPIAQIRSAEVESEEAPSAVAQVGAVVGAVQGTADDAVEQPPRLPLGEEPLPALSYPVQERLFQAWNRAPVEQAPGPPPELVAAALPPADLERQILAQEQPPAETTGTATEEAVDTDARDAELVGQAPASPEEVAQRLARVAGEEAARAFVEELRSMVGPEVAETDQVATTPESAQVAEDPERFDPLAPDEMETQRARQMENAEQAAVLALALQNALVPLLGAGVPAQAAPPVDPGGAAPRSGGSSVQGTWPVGSGSGLAPALPPTGFTGPAVGTQVPGSLSPGSLVPSPAGALPSSPLAPASPMAPSGPMAPASPMAPMSPMGPSPGGGMLPAFPR